MIRLGVFIFAGVSILPSAGVVAQDDLPASHVHIRHVADNWDDAPSRVGLMILARMEAEIANAHAELAVASTDLAAIRRHVSHVMHAIDPTSEERGPGRGYGVIQASTDGIIHVGLAAGSEGASDNVRLHATHVTASLETVLSRAREIVMLGYQAGAATDPEVAAELVEQIRDLTSSLINGLDANADGSVGWEAGEGGLTQAASHLYLMKQGEGML